MLNISNSLKKKYQVVLKETLLMRRSMGEALRCAGIEDKKASFQK